MDPRWSLALRSWEWRPEVVLVLVLAGAIFGRGWWRLRQQGRGRLAARWRLASYMGGLTALALALLSPIDTLGSYLFFVHMIQHLLLMMLAPPLLLAANPFPFILWGLPAGVQEEVVRLFRRQAPFRRFLRTATTPGLTWMLFIAIFLGWHDPGAYNAALRSDLVHDLEHLSFFGSGMLFWWHATAAGPRLHRFSQGARLAYLLSVVPPNMLTGVAIAFAQTPIYTYYATIPRAWGMTPIADQRLGGVIMWIPGSMMYLLAALILITRLIQAEDQKPLLPESRWATDEAMIAPGLEGRAHGQR